VAEIVGRPLAVELEKSLRPAGADHQPARRGRRGGHGLGGQGRGRLHAADGLSSISIFPVSDRINGKAPAYELKDFAPIALITADPTVLVVRTDGPYKTLKDFVDAAKASPGKINYSSSGVYGTLHVSMEIFANAAGSKLFHVPYQGGGPAVTALLGGQVEALASGPAPAIGQIRGAKMRALASWSSERLALLPEIPTFKELGYDADSTSGPASSRRNHAAQPSFKNKNAVKEAANSAEFKAAMEKVQTPVAYSTRRVPNYWERDAARLKVALERSARSKRSSAARMNAILTVALAASVTGLNQESAPGRAISM